MRRRGATRAARELTNAMSASIEHGRFGDRLKELMADSIKVRLPARAASSAP